MTEWGIFAQIPSGVEGCIRVEKLDGGVYTYDEKTYSLTCGSRRYRLGDSVVIKVDEVAATESIFPSAVTRKNKTLKEMLSFAARYGGA